MLITFATASHRSFLNYRARLSYCLMNSFTIGRKPRVSKLAHLLDIVRPYWKDSLVITSDGKVNLFYLLFVFGNQLIILNGLGKYERNRFVRKILLFSQHIKKNSQLCCQSYRDYRYFQRFMNSKVYWIPGSGGTLRTIGNNPIPLIVSRQRKFAMMGDVISTLSLRFKKIYVLGLEEHESKRSFEFIEFLGKRKQTDIFNETSLFLQLDGYGEGVPHSLVDAICSKMDIIIQKKCWIKFGFYKIINENIKPLEKYDGYYYIDRNSSLHEKLRQHLNEDKVFSQYSKILNEISHAIKLRRLQGRK